MRDLRLEHSSISTLTDEVDKVILGKQVLLAFLPHPLTDEPLFFDRNVVGFRFLLAHLLLAVIHDWRSVRLK